MRPTIYLLSALAFALATPAIANACASGTQWYNHGYFDYWNAYRNNTVNPFYPISRWTRPRTPPSDCESAYANGVRNANLAARNLEVPIF